MSLGIIVQQFAKIKRFLLMNSDILIEVCTSNNHKGFENKSEENKRADLVLIRLK
jgi:hypothetical protein